MAQIAEIQLVFDYQNVQHSVATKRKALPDDVQLRDVIGCAESVA